MARGEAYPLLLLKATRPRSLRTETVTGSVWSVQRLELWCRGERGHCPGPLSGLGRTQVLRNWGSVYPTSLGLRFKAEEPRKVRAWLNSVFSLFLFSSPSFPFPCTKFYPYCVCPSKQIKEADCRVKQDRTQNLLFLHPSLFCTHKTPSPKTS